MRAVGGLGGIGASLAPKPWAVYNATRARLLSDSNINFFVAGQATEQADGQDSEGDGLRERQAAKAERGQEENEGAHKEGGGSGQGLVLQGLGSQHHSFGLRPVWPGPECTSKCVWSLGLVMQAWTAQSAEEEAAIVNQLVTTAQHNLLHEG